jgi:aconitate hydratase 2/2-methylisocitrate dehydratase
MLRKAVNFKNSINNSLNERVINNIPMLPLNVEQVSTLCSIIELKQYLNYELLSDKDFDFFMYLFKEKIVPGVDETSYLKANFLNKICLNQINTDLIDKKEAISILGTMQGGYNVEILTNLLDNHNLAELASNELKKTILVFDHYYDIEKKSKMGNIYATEIIKSWADAEWFKNNKPLNEKISLTVFKVNGETNTDDLSPAQDAWSRPDIPLHAQSMLKNPRNGIIPDKDYEIGPLKMIKKLKKKLNPVVYVGDVVGTGSSRKSATNSILWHFGNAIPYVPNKKTGGFCFGGKIAPIFYSTMEDSGALPIELDVDKMYTGQVIDLYPYENIVCDHNTDDIISEFTYKTDNVLDSVRAGGRINLIIGKSLTEKAKKTLKDTTRSIFISNKSVVKDKNQKYTLAQKMVGKACGVDGVLPGSYCEPTVTSVGSQDTTGPMTRDELKDLACLGFSADLVMQSFCHTAAYPKPVDVITHNTLPDFIKNRGGISLRPGDGIIHSWLNRMLLPDTVGTGGDSHTRFPIGISFPAGSGLVAFAGATGIMPLDMPESILVKFTGEIQPGITLRDLVHSIPYIARQKKLLTLDKTNKKNIFNGNILEIEGLPNLTCEQAFELSDASAERSAAGCTIKLNKEPVIEYLKSNIALLKWMIKEDYNDKNTIKRRINKMQEWLDNPILLEADEGAKYKEVIEIDLNKITEPILCAPNDPDHAVTLSEVCGRKIDEVFIGSCMTNIGHFRAAGELLKNHEKQLDTKLWISPPTKMDEKKLKEENYYKIFERVGAKLEMPGCSLCMGNQARVEDNSWVLSTSTRNFPNRLGKGANVYLASSELSAITAIENEIPSYDTYIKYFKNIEQKKDKIFSYMNFDKLDEYVK